MILEAPDGRRIEALRRDSGYAHAQVNLIGHSRCEMHMGVDSALHTGALLIAASVIARGALDTVHLPGLIAAVRHQIASQIAWRDQQASLTAAILRQHAEHCANR